MTPWAAVAESPKCVTCANSPYLFSAICFAINQKPDNVGFSKDGTLKMFDFGLAKEEKSMDGDDYGTYKMTGQTGSRRYMAPEGRLPVDKNIVYNVGV